MEGLQLGSGDQATNVKDAGQDDGGSANKPAQPGLPEPSTSGGGDSMQWGSSEAKDAAFDECVARGSGDAFFAEAPISPILARKAVPVLDDQELVPDYLKMPPDAGIIVGDLGQHRGYVFRNKPDIGAAAAAEKNIPKST
ncbi:hypothetical protein HPB50_017815 [Hyalomma asiaticum]|uniref:Uncharacterized protein n=1 Tax=Hyalomma asiaticum TaxID=266040 RepID=A0ACB7SZC3_HYAAI|nr:hypothetical protein HPB50_017815 [Hyalomma asiaticum]